jgi:transposase-like protein
LQIRIELLVATRESRSGHVLLRAAQSQNEVLRVPWSITLPFVLCSDVRRHVLPRLEGEKWKDYRNGYYTRDFVTRFGTLRLRIARTRKRGFLPAVMKKFQRRAEEVALLIREAFLRGISTRRWDGW